MSRSIRFVGKVLRYVVLGLLALLLVMAVLFIYLTTDSGERRIANYIESSVDESIAGSLELSNLEFHGDSVDLYGVKIKSPAGDTVITVEEVNLDIDLWSVLGDQIVLEELVVREYAVWVRQQDGQTSLQTTFEPTEPTEEDQRSVRIDKLALLDGMIVAYLGEQEDPAFQIEDLDVSGSLLTGKNLRFDLTGTGQVEDMAPGKLAITADLRQTEDGMQELAFDGSLDTNVIHGQVALPSEPGEDFSLSEIEGRLAANISSFEHQGMVYGPIDIDAHLADERLEVAEARIELPGLLLNREPAQDDTVVLVIQLRSLAQIVEALSAFPGPRLPALAGSGAMTLRISNPITSPRLAFQGQMHDLRYGEGEEPITVQRLKVEGRIEDLTRRGTAHLRADLTALRSGERSVASARLEATLENRELTLDAHVGAPYRANLHVEAERITEDEARIDVLTLSYPRTQWRAAEPAYLRFGRADGSLEELVLVSGEQRVEVDARWAPAKRLDAKLSKVQLASIPRAALEDAPDLRGILNAELQLEMAGDVVRGQVNASLADWEVASAAGKRATLDARLADERVTGTFSMQAYGGRVDATFDAPASTGEQAADQPIEAEVRIKSLQLAAMWRDLSSRMELPSAGKIQSLSGQLGGLVRISGTALQPVPSGDLRLSNGAVTLTDGNSYRGIRMRIQGTEKKLELRELIVRAGDGQASARGTATQIAPNSYRYDLSFDVAAFPLPGEQPMLATAKGSLEGSASKGRVEAELSFRDVVVEEQPAEKKPRQIAIACGDCANPPRSVHTRSGRRPRLP